MFGAATNVAPLIDNLLQQQQKNQTSVTTISVIDNDFNESLTFSIQGSDSNSFNITNSGVLSFISAPNYEVDKKSYEQLFQSLME